MLADKFLRRSIVVRELMPQDLNLEMDQLRRDEAVSAARYLATVVGKAPARQMTPECGGSRLRSASKPHKEPRCSRLDVAKRGGPYRKSRNRIP